MNIALYEITEDIHEILTTEEWDDATVQRLDSLELALEKKAENIIHFCANLDSFTEAAKAEEKRIAERRKAAENRVSRLKEYVKHCMERADRTTVSAGTHTIKIQKNPPKVVVTDEGAIPPGFFTVIPQTLQLNKTRLAEKLKLGEVIPGAKLEQGTSIRIR